jgi:hypothetical protein
MKSVIRRLIITIIFYLLIGYINQFAAENQVYHNINSPPLFDRGHNLIPLIPKSFPDIGLIIFGIYFFIRWCIKYPETLINYLWMISLLFIGRVMLFSVTQIPPSLPGCSSVQSDSKLNFAIFKKGWNTCIDYMYSGHTIHCVLITLFTLYLSTYLFEKFIIILALFIEIIFIIGSRIHYTSDVMIGTLVTILIFYSWPGIGYIIDHIYSGGIYGSTLLHII